MSVISTSSAQMCTPSIPSIASNICRWYSPGADLGANGRRFHLYLLIEVMKVVNILDSWSKSTFRNPFLTSRTVINLALSKYGKIYSTVGSIKCGRLFSLFKILGSMHILKDLFTFVATITLDTETLGSESFILFIVLPFTINFVSHL